MECVKALPELLKGDAFLWYRNTKALWHAYEEFLDNFKEQYLHPDYFRNLDGEILQRMNIILTTAPVLSCPDFTEPFVLKVDASDERLGASLTQ